MIFLNMYMHVYEGFQALSENQKNEHITFTDNPKDVMLNFDFAFSPALSPNFNGKCERLIGLIKKKLNPILEKHLLYYSELHDVLCRIKGFLNYRPIAKLQAERNKPETIITLAHFLHQKSLITQPDPLEVKTVLS